MLLDPQLLERLSKEKYTAILTVVAGFTAILATKWLFTAPDKRNYVTLPAGPFSYLKGQLRYLLHADDMIREGIAQYGENTPFWLPSMIGPMLLAPRYLMNEIKNHPHLSFAHFLKATFSGKHTGMGEPFADPQYIGIIKGKLTKALNSFTPEIEEEIIEALKDRIPLDEEWTPHIAFPGFCQSIVARSSARIFIGAELCRDQRWLHIATRYTAQMVGVTLFLKLWPEFLKPFSKYLSPSWWRAAAMYSRARILIAEVVTKRQKELASAGSEAPPRMDGIQWALDLGMDLERMTEFEITMAIASVHNTAVALTQLVLDLCERREYIQILREEIREVLGDGPAGNNKGINGLQKMDSFLKESQRTSPPQHATMQRRAMKDIEFSDGTKLKEGEFVMFDSDSVLSDARYYENPEVFDGLRFYNLRQHAENEATAQYANTNEQFFVFGNGKSACPGRFFAGHELKLILVYLLRMYDFKFPDGQTKRPANLHYEDIIIPAKGQQILFRRRRV